jgi:signal transduction histidine kinase
MDPGETPMRAADAADVADAKPRRTTASRDIEPRMVAGRALLSALRAQDDAEAAEAARARAEFLAEAGLRLGASLEEELTHGVIAGLALPGPDAWCVVDVITTAGALHRLAVVHPDEGKAAVARALVDRWTPAADDRIGVPAVARDHAPVLVTDGVDDAIAATARDADTLRVLQWLGAGSFLVVPVLSHDVLLGAITYVSRPGSPVYAPEDVRLAEALAARCAQALEAARLYSVARAARAEADDARAVADAARAEAESANATKAQFLRTTSHELRTPLSAIGGYTDIIEMGIHGPVTDQQRADLARIRASQRHLLEIVDEVLEFAQIETGTVRYTFAAVPVSEAIAGARDLVEPRARDKGVVLTVDEGAPGVAIHADATKLRQVLVNLLSNAVKFTGAGGRVHVACAASDTTVILSVDDSGIGIAPTDFERVFEPFVQVDGGHTRPHEGMGLGLAISRDLARGMHGDLVVESVTGQGSTFTLTLPRAETSL